MLSESPFLDDLRFALEDLYDPVALGHSLLIAQFSLENTKTPALALRQHLLAAIAALEPAEEVSPDSPAWRYFHLLSQRYVEQNSQPEVAKHLNLSPRQVRRLQPKALVSLAQTLDFRGSLSTEVERQSNQGAMSVDSWDDASPIGRADEFERLCRTEGAVSVEWTELVDSVLETLAPILAEKDVKVDCFRDKQAKRVTVQMTTARHALLNVFSTLIRHLEKGVVSIEAEQGPAELILMLRCTPARQQSHTVMSYQNCDSLQLARHLLSLSGGSISTREAEDSRSLMNLFIRLPTESGVPVLVIDDNPDALHLIRRQLAGSRYAFVGTDNAASAVRIAEDVSPHIVLLDLMLPDTDGWAVLGHLREHPTLGDIPVVVCTILPQKDLALALGAADLLRKPFSRQELLAALDVQSGVRAR